MGAWEKGYLDSLDTECAEIPWISGMRHSLFVTYLLIWYIRQRAENI